MITIQRLIAVILAASLLIDPSLALAVSTPRQLHPTSVSLFSEQAFNLPAAVFGHLGINQQPTARVWQWTAVLLIGTAGLVITTQGDASFWTLAQSALDSAYKLFHPQAWDQLSAAAIGMLIPVSNPLAMADGKPNGTVRKTITYELSKLDADYGFLPETHPVVQHANQLLSSLIDDANTEDRPRIYILATLGNGANAWIYPDGSIVLTPELFQFNEYVEENLAVVAHELMHLRKQHFDKHTEAGKRLSWEDVLALQRYHEYEADAGAFMLLADKGFNNLGFISFMDRLRKHNLGWGLVHGTSTDRMLNLQTITYLAEIPALTRQLTPLPEEIKISLKDLPYGNRVDRIIGADHDYDRKTQTDRMELAENAKWPLLRQSFRYIIKRINKLGESMRSRDGWKLQREWEINFLNMLSARFEPPFRERASTLNSDETLALRQIILMVSFEVPYDLEKPAFDVGGTATRYTRKLNRAFLKTVSTVLESNAWNPERDPFPSHALESFLLQSLQVVKNKGDYENTDGNFDYQAFLQDAHGLIKSAVVYAEKAATDPLSKERLWTRFLIMATEEFFALGNSDPAALNAFFHYAQSNGYPAVSGTYWNRVLEQSSVITSPRDRGRLLKLVTTQSILQTKVEDPSIRDLYSKLMPILVTIEKRDTRLDPNIAEGYSIDKELSRQIVEATRGSSIKDLSKVLGLLRMDAPGFGIDAETASRMASYLLSEILHRKDFDDISIDRDLDLMAFAQIHLRETQLLIYTQDRFIHCQPNLYTIENLNQIANASLHPEQNTRRLNGTPLEHVAINLDENSHFRWNAYNTFYNNIKKTEDINEFFNQIDTFLKQRRLVSVLDIANEYDSAVEDFQDELNLIVKKGYGWIQHLPADDPSIPKRIFLLSYFTNDALIQNHLQNYYLREFIEHLSFPESVALVFHDYALNRSAGFSAAIEHLIEEKAASTSDFEALRQEFQGLLEMGSTGSEGFAGLLGLDAFMEVAFKNQERLLNALLRSGQDDSELKTYLFEVWYGFYAKRGLRESRLPGANEKLRPVEMFGTIPYYPLSVILDAIYRMNSASKYTLLRKLLMGEKGILKNKAARERFINQFIEQSVTTDDRSVMAMLRETLTAMTEAASDDELYFAVYPLLLSRIANPPVHPIPWDPIVQSYAEKEYDRLNRTYRSQDLSEYYDGDSGRRKRTQGIVTSITSEEELDQQVKRSPKTKEVYLQRLRTRIIQRIEGGDDKERPTQNAAQELFLRIPEEFYRQATSRLSPEEFVVEVGKNLRNPGVRFLQLFVGFVDLPESFRKQVLHVYDDLKGQSRLAAYEVAKREIPEVLAHVKKFGKRIGGGSMGTVYEIEMDDGSREAWQVLNPNAEYHTQGIIDLMRRTVRLLARKNPAYNVALPLLDNMEEWILGDINDASFITDDQTFAKANQDFQPRGFTSRIHVPGILGQTDHITRMEFVPGEDLKEMPNWPSSERRETVALAAQNYMHQLRGAWSDLLSGKPSIVHSDVTIGNLRRTNDSRLAILDRSYYLHINTADKKALSALSTAKSTRDQAQILVRYLWDHPKNQPLAQRLVQSDNLQSFETEVVDGITGLDAAHTQELNLFDALRVVREKGLFVPVKIDLLVKNLNNLKRLAIEADSQWSSLDDALAYNPSKGGASWFQTATGWYERIWAHRIETRLLIPLLTGTFTILAPTVLGYSLGTIGLGALVTGAAFILPHGKRMFNPDILLLAAGTVGVAAIAMQAFSAHSTFHIAAALIAVEVLTQLHWYNNNVRPLHQTLFAKAA